MSSSIILGSGGSVDLSISSPIQIPSENYNRNLYIGVSLSGNVKESFRGDGTWQTVSGSEIVAQKTDSVKFPFNQIMYRNKVGDNNIDTSIIPNITISSIDTVNHKMVVSDLPPGVDLNNPTSGEPWIIMNVDSWSNTGVNISGDCQAFFKITNVNTTTKEITYVYYNNGWAETSNSAGHKIVFYNPFEDGFTRNTSNPIFEASDFSSLGSYKYLSNLSYFWKQNGDFVVFIGGLTTTYTWDILYGTTSDFVTWTPGTSKLFTTRPTWASSYFFPEEVVEYDEDEGLYFCHGKGSDGTEAGIGWIRFSEDFLTYEISPSSIISKDEIDLFLPDGLETNSIVISNISVVEDNGLWIMFTTLFTKYYGTHTGSSGTTTLTDSSAKFEPDTLQMEYGTPVKNITQGTSGYITGNTITTVDTTISWNTSDSYEIDDVITRRQVVAISNSKYGPFRLVHMKPLRDYAASDGNTGSRWLDINNAFVYKGEIYAIINATSKTIESGTKANRVSDLYRLDKRSYNLVRLSKNPIFTGLTYTDKFGYTEYNWEADHLGSVRLAVDEKNNLLHIIYDATYGTDNYKIGHAYKSLTTIS